MRILATLWLTAVLGCAPHGAQPSDMGAIDDAALGTPDQASDAPKDMASGAPADLARADMLVDPCAAPPTADFYVDASNGNDANSGSSPRCPLRTITAALAASAGSEHDNATIHLAAGLYGSGETFPLVVNHGRSIVGAGAASKIQGSSASYNTSGTGSFLDQGTHYLTILAGDALGDGSRYGRTTLSRLTLLPDGSLAAPTAGYLGVACIVGNAPNTGATPPLPSPNLLIQNVTVGPNYDTGIAIGGSPSASSACNATVTQSRLTGMTTGIATGVCGTTNPVQSWPSAQIGDGVPSDGNTFSSCAIDLFGGGCGSAQSIDGNTFQSGYRGVVLVSQAAQYFEILGNTFSGGSAAFPMGIGVQTNSSATIHKLDGNTLTGIAQSADADSAAGQTTGYALMIGSVLEAHQNVIHDNDNGVEVAFAPSVSFDFSADGAPSNANEIYCNSKPSGGAANGYDVILAYKGGVVANFAGNLWDHGAPLTGSSLTETSNGTELVTGTSGGATVAGSGAIAASCGGSRVH